MPRRPRPWPARPSSCRCWPGPAWSTPGAPATSCCSMRSGSSSAGAPSRSRSRRRSRSTSRNWERRSAPQAREQARAQARAGEGLGDHAVGDLRYEVMYLLDAPDDSMDDFKEVWAGIGDSIVVVGGDGLWNCHIHTDDIGAAIEAGARRRATARIRVTDLAEQVEEERWVREGAEAPGAGPAWSRPAHRREPAWWRWSTGDGHRAHLPLARRAPPGGGRPVDEPLDAPTWWWRSRRPGPTRW